MANLVPSVVLEGVAELIEQNGQDPVELFRRVGIPGAALLEPNVLIRPEHYADLLELAAGRAQIAIPVDCGKSPAQVGAFLSQSTRLPRCASSAAMQQPPTPEPITIAS